MKQLFKLFVGFWLLLGITAPVWGQTNTTNLYTGNVKEISDHSIKNAKKAHYGYEIVEDISIPMEDGINLSAVAAYPTDLKTGQRAKGLFPVIVEHMPYEQFRNPVRVNPYYAQNGYISLFVRARGTGKSEGEVQFLSPREGLDGKDIVEFASNTLAGSNGKVGIVGCSWPGAISINDAAYVGKNSPLKAVVAACSGLGNMNTQSWMTGGMPSMSIWSFKFSGTALVGDKPSTRKFFESVSDGIINGEDLAYEGKYWSERENFDLAKKIVANEVVLLLWAGWGDIVETGTIRAYTALQNAYAKRNVGAPMQPNQPTSNKYQIIMGGWNHGEGLDMHWIVRWFDTWLKGEETEFSKATYPMHVFENGTQRWLNMKGFTNTDAVQSFDLMEVNGANLLEYTQPNAKNGKLVFETDIFEKGGTISGAMSVSLRVKSSNQNMVLIGHLYDVNEKGEKVLISRGAMIGSLAKVDRKNSWIAKDGTNLWPWRVNKKDKLLVPNKEYRWDLSLAPRQYGIKPGHRLSFELISQTSEDLCPKNALPKSNEAEPCGLTKTQEQTVPGGIYTIDQAQLNLPLLPYEYFESIPARKPVDYWQEGFRMVFEPEDNIIYTLPSIL